MKLEKWALVAEIFSAIAVVITLIFLIVEIGENTDVLEASQYADLMDGLNEFQTAQMTDTDSVRVWDAYIYEYVDELDSLDRQRLALAVLTLFRIYESAFVARQRDLMEDSEWARFEDASCVNFFRVQRVLDDDLGLLSGTLTPGFLNHMANNCEE